MENVSYLVTLTQDEGGWIVAECPALPGCVSQGRSRDEALTNIREAISSLIELRRDRDWPIPRPEVVEVSVAA
jgi:predicted RNase H-like HicB family nuclease